MKESPFGERYERFREILREERKKAGLTQVELAKKLAQPQNFISNYERGERRLDVIEMIDILKAIGVDPHEILEKLIHLSLKREEVSPPAP